MNHNFLLFTVVLLTLRESGAFFCEDNSSHYPTSKTYRNFPTDVPSDSFTPWVWDAVYDGERNTVEITIIPRSACSFNKSLWQRAVYVNPDYKHLLADGLLSNILVPEDENRLVLFTNLTKNMPKRQRNYVARSLAESHVMLHETLLCKFYRFGKVIYTSISERINGKVPNMRHGTVQVVCPSLQRVKFDGISLLRNFTLLKPAYDGLGVLFQSIKETDIFIPCSTSQLQIGIEMESKSKPYKISLCTASSRILENGFVEWIEYHRLIGIDHFFVYNTAMSPLYSNIVAKYVNIGLLTLIHWPYSDCVKGMASARAMQWNDTQNTAESIYFLPPKCISQSGALASCYSRYRKTSKYMVHIDDDEFLALNTSSSLSKSVSWGESLVQFVDKLFHEYPKKIAIGFRQVSKLHCPTKIKGKQLDTPESTLGLPRVGRWQHTKCGSMHEQKLIMKTDSVRMFYLHYLSQVESRLGPPNRHTVLLANMTDAVLLHYKVPFDISGDIFGGPVVNSFEKIERCHQHLLQTGHEDGNNLLAIGRLKLPGPMIKRISNELLELLRISYRAIMAQGKG
mmetsp:Transcript_24260/g.23315  ORF Transcript_24260/g.23315 Transcript_24260/m.23315 type:complete len:568 (+) Transcript_24260:830-2533(+)